MSRTYLLMGAFEGLTKKQVEKFFFKLCGKEQILKLKEDYVWVEMGCSSGVPPEDSMYCLRDQLKEIGAKEIELDIWSLHPDNMECSYSYEEEKEGQ